MKVNRVFIIWFLIALMLAVIDLISKHMIASYLRSIAYELQIYNPKISIFGFFDIVYVWNSGVSFGMFNNIAHSHIILSILQGLISLVVLLFLYKSKDNLSRISFSLIFGGALGNVLDRIWHGAVFDFLDFYIGKYHWPAFNFADSFIFLGVVILLHKEFFYKKNENPEKKD